MGNLFFLAAMLMMHKAEEMTGYVELANRTFVCKHRMLADYSTDELKQMRFTGHSNVRLLMNVLLLPDRWEMKNGSVCHVEEGFMMWLSWIAFPRRLSTMQYDFGIEYSQISRIIAKIWQFLYTKWKHLVQNNFAYFVSRFPAYNAAIVARYKNQNRVNHVPAHWRNVSCFTDGTLS